MKGIIGDENSEEKSHSVIQQVQASIPWSSRTIKVRKSRQAMLPLHSFQISYILERSTQGTHPTGQSGLTICLRN